MYEQIFRELLVMMMSNPSIINQATQLLLVGLYLERIGDHATNIAEWVHYMVLGKKPSTKWQGRLSAGTVFLLLVTCQAGITRKEQNSIS